MFINTTDVDKYLCQYRYLNLTFEIHGYKIILQPNKTDFLVTVYNDGGIVLEQHVYDGWDLATYNFNALCCIYMRKSTQKLSKKNSIKKKKTNKNLGS